MIYERKIGDIFREYQARLQRAGAMDFDDLLGKTVELLHTQPDLLAHYQRRFKHVLVDEYQDTNVVQNDLVLAPGQGAPQRLRRRRRRPVDLRVPGADMRNILEFENAFPDVTIVVLEQNYRSTQTILDAANAVIANNLSRKPKELWTDRGDGNPIVRYHADDEVDEAQWVTREVAKLHDGGDLRWADIAVFYRTNAQSRVVEEHLTRMGVPYKVIGGTRFYDRREVKDALAYLKAVINPTDEVSVKRILNTPKRGHRRRQRRQARRLRLGPRHQLHGRAPSLRRRRRERHGGEGHRRVPRAARLGRRAGRRRRAGAAAPGAARPLRLPRSSSRRSAPSRPRAGSRTWPSWSAPPRTPRASTCSSSR